MAEGIGRQRAKGGTTSALGTVGSMFVTEEELGKLGKKDDDHIPRMHLYPLWWKSSPRLKRRKAFYALISFLLVSFIYHFRASSFKNGMIPSTKWRTEAQSSSQSQRLPDVGDVLESKPPKKTLSKPHSEGTISSEHYYDGPIIFHQLTESLRAFRRTYGYRSVSRTVLFAASNLQSLSGLIPMACDMSRHEKNKVHLAVFGRHDLSLETLRTMNGVDDSKCNIYWHDARPDYAVHSTDARAEAATRNAMMVISQHLRPQALILCDSTSEDDFFIETLRNKPTDSPSTLIGLPVSIIEKFMWISSMDASALAAWDKNSIDILVQATPDSTGSLMRLLTSLYTADYTGVGPPPRLIIELPSEVDIVAKHFLQNFRWPPPPYADVGPSGYKNQLILRRRLPTSRLSPEEASIRFLESFYPANMLDNHVLILSPQAQVSPLYFHYLKYHILEYRYSSSFSAPHKLMGISLENPTTYLNGTTLFVSPDFDKTSFPALASPRPASSSIKPSFQWQAPSSNAALYFGDKWVEFHSFLSHRLRKFHSAASSPISPKLISADKPAWTEYLLEFMQCRGYSLLYPGVPDTKEKDEHALVTLHSERFVPPEEFLQPSEPSEDQSSVHTPVHDLPPDGEPFDFPPTPPSPPPTKPREPNLAENRMPLHLILPFLDGLPDPAFLPHLSYDGTSLGAGGAASLAQAYAAEFRTTVGGCAPPLAGRTRKVRPGDAADLFCHGGEEKDAMEWESTTNEPLIVDTSGKSRVATAKEQGHSTREGGIQQTEDAHQNRGISGAEAIVERMRSEALRSIGSAAEPAGKVSKEGRK